ncbi:hypothetical protein SNE40_005477 [Patella caerulea]|uniref:Gamma-glutamyltransferase n=1 Tax=Patella caerulea TaxID=87958 RepID=A0AAN8K1S6_PATCE
MATIEDNYSFTSRRSPVISIHGLVSTSQPLASQIGIDILKAGGNAADAAVAVAAALNITEPCSTGIGGDAFCLFYDGKTKSVHGVNGSGRAPLAANLELYKSSGFTRDTPVPMRHGLTVTVPGAASAWIDTIERHGSGKLTLKEILQPAIDLAENGAPIQQTAAYFWKQGSHLLKDPKNIHGKDMLLNGEPPAQGDVIKMPKLANTFRELANNGKDGFYKGRIAQAVVDVITNHGGVMSLADLLSHKTTYDQPISVDYKGCRVWEIPPNGQGIVALMALNILEKYDLKKAGHNSAEYLHLLIEALRLSFADGRWYCADPSVTAVPVEELLSKEYAATRRNLIHTDRASSDIKKGSPFIGSDTVYFTVADEHGNACSFINSNFMGFGTGLVPEGCGFTLQNRGYGFSLDPDHPNRLEPGKRPYHTIIPAMVTSADTGELLCSYGVMGGFMQPQGHVQVLLNMIEFHMDPQQALDSPRICLGGGYGLSGDCAVEEGISEETIAKLKSMGHKITGPVKGYERSMFGRGQVISKGNWWCHGSSSTDTWWGGCDPRADSVAIGY